MVDLSRYDEIIIWGAAFPPSEVGALSTSHGHAMEKLAVLLKDNNVWHKVVGIVDSNKSIQGREHLRVKVHEPEFILQHPEALVVINSISICAIKRAMDVMQIKNDCAVIPYYFYHGTLDYPYRNEVAKEVIQLHGAEIRNLYFDDELTKKYLDIIFALREQEDQLYELSFYNGTGENMAYFCDPELSPSGDVTYIDVGAFDGDSLSPVEKYYGDKLKKYIGFEPDINSMEKLKSFIEDKGLTGKASVFPYALGSDDGYIRFSITGSTSQESENGDIVLEKRRFDNLEINMVGDVMVKMDIEGAELEALNGMQNFIRTHKPYLAICIYHKEADIFDIADYIKSLYNGYRLYIRGGYHLECWAVPERHFN